MKEVKLSLGVINGVYSALTLKQFKQVHKVCTQIEELSQGVQEGDTHVVVPAELVNDIAFMIGEMPYFEVFSVGKALNSELLQQMNEFRESQKNETVENSEEESKNK